MKISFSRIKNSLQTIRSTSPVSLILIWTILGLGLNMIRERNLLGEWNDGLSSSALAIALLWFATVFITSAQKSSWSRKDIIQILSVIIVGIFVWRWLLIRPIPNQAQIINMVVIFGVALLSLVGRAMFGTERKDSAVHQRVLSIIEQIWIAWAFTVLLWGWISLALLAIQSLFGVTIIGEWYWTIRAWCVTILWWISLLDGVISWDTNAPLPDQIHKRKRILAWVLWFLLWIFGIILTVYMLKILITRNRPSNEVSFWAFLYSGLVIAASIILLPIWQDDNDQLYTIRKRMYISLLPMCVMIGFAIFQRVEQYGITMERYLVIAFLLWLTSISILMVFRPRTKIRWLFASLMWVWIFSVVARPINARNVSLSSQVYRTVSLLESTGQIDEKWTLTIPLRYGKEVNDTQKNNIASAITYIVRDMWSDLEQLHPDLTQDKDIFETLWIEPTFGRFWILPGSWMWWPMWWNIAWEERYKNFWFDTNSEIDISGYSKMYNNLYTNNISDNYGPNTPPSSIEDTILTINIWTWNILSIELEPLIQKLLLRPDSNNRWESSIPITYDSWNTRLLIQHISLEKEKDVWKINDMGYWLLVK